MTCREIRIDPVCCPILSSLARLRKRARSIGLAGLLLPSPGLCGAIHFTDVTASANILHTHSHAPDADFWLPSYGWKTGGAVAEDFDGDGWIDLYVLQGGASPNLLYMNQRDGTFTDQAAARGAGLTGAHMGACAADFDGDGDIDLFVSAATAPHVLLVNDGSGHFNVDPQVFAVPPIAATSPSWGDVDNDGLLDLAIGAWNREGTGDIRIYRNTGAGRLRLHQSLPRDWTFTPRFADLDGDGFQDLLSIADFGQTVWYRNGSDGLLRPAGTSDVENGMGAAVGDIDDDGDLDVFISSIRDFDEREGNWGTTGNRLLLNGGSGEFSDITGTAGVRDGFWGWGTAFADFDNDGDLDIYQVNGWPDGSPVVAAQFDDKPARLFENLGNHQFQEIAAAWGDAAHAGQGRCVVVFDYDNDGDLDIFIANNSVLDRSGPSPVRIPGPPVLLRNDSGLADRSLLVRLAGLVAPHHRHGIGSRVFATIGTVTQMRELNASSGYNGHGPERIAHFGTGDALLIDSVRAVWTNGDETELRNVSAGSSLEIPSPRATLSLRTIDPGQSVTAEIAAADLPSGATARWFAGGQEFDNPATITPAAAGRHPLRLVISDAQGFVRSETLTVTVRAPEIETMSVARQWNEQNLAAIRLDFPNPPVHARNLFLLSLAMWDAWAAYDRQALAVLHHERADAADIEAARDEAISHAAFRVISARYAGSVNASTTLASIRQRMLVLGFDPDDSGLTGNVPAALGNRVAQTVLDFASTDGASDPAGFAGGSYVSSNNALAVSSPGTVMIDPNRWQPLLFKQATTQNGQPADLIQSFLGAHWGGVRPFAQASLAGNLLNIDPGPPPALGGMTDAMFKQDSVEVITLSGLLDPEDGNMVDISPGVFGNHPLGTNGGTGHPLNPVTGLPYPPNVVRHGDFGRVLAEFWADGPHSETPPGHWNVLANEVSDAPGFLRRIGGSGPELGALEWDVKVYLALNGALHDAAIAAWGCKRVYDSARPVSCIRYMGGRGQSSAPALPSYDPQGLPLVPGVIELITADSSAPGCRHAHLASHPHEIAIKAWTAKILPAGVHWIRAVDWLPYQRDTFVTPAFPGFVSGHSTFSRAAAEVLARITGSAFFPGGIGSFAAPRGSYLKTDAGPSDDLVLQWATYFDAADQAGISRLYGGIHVPADDLPGRVLGSRCGTAAWALAVRYFDGSIAGVPFAARLLAAGEGGFHLEWDCTRGAFYQVQQADDPAFRTFSNIGGLVRAAETMEMMKLPGPAMGSPRKFFRVIRSHEGQ